MFTVLTGSKLGGLNGARFQPRKYSSGVWNSNPIFRANYKDEREGKKTDPHLKVTLKGPVCGIWRHLAVRLQIATNDDPCLTLP